MAVETNPCENVRMGGKKPVCIVHRREYGGKECPKCAAARKRIRRGPTTLKTLRQMGWR